jgi:blue copper oxidase
MRSLSRRRLLAAASASALGTGAGFLWWRERSRDSEPALEQQPAAKARASPNRIPGVAGLMEYVDAGQPFNVSARSLEHEVTPNRRINMLAYDVEQGGRNFLNPVLRVRQGAVIQAKFWNQLDETSIIHWHGLRVDANNDGNPHYAVQPGEIYAYRIPLRNRAATCWYHPHPHGLSAGQIYRGLASFLIVEDAEDDALAQALDLKLGVTDLPLLLQDRRLDATGQFVRSPNASDMFLGYLGSEPMVNYAANAHLDVNPRIYRLRLLNGSSARIYRLAFMAADKAYPFHVIGTDGGLLQRPIAAEEAFLAPAERLDVLIDFRALAPSSKLVLRSLEFDAMREPIAQLCATLPEQLARASHTPHAQAAAPRPAASPTPQPPADGASLDLLTIEVRHGPTYQPQLPGKLSKLPGIDSRNARVRTFDLDHERMQWRINGIRFDMLATQVSVERGSTEIWELRNPPFGMPHPMHFHGFPFRLLERKSSPEQVRRLAVDQRGLSAAETGWKDTVLVWPGERVRLALDFSHDYPGEQVYMLHCHNLEHEDQGMMLNVRIVPPGRGRT